MMENLCIQNNAITVKLLSFQLITSNDLANKSSVTIELGSLSGQNHYFLLACTL